MRTGFKGRGVHSVQCTEGFGDCYKKFNELFFFIRGGHDVPENSHALLVKSLLTQRS
jgi:hypothetical protein